MPADFTVGVENHMVGRNQGSKNQWNAGKPISRKQ
jgi:hypothetical protein